MDLNQPLFSAQPSLYVPDEIQPPPRVQEIVAGTGIGVAISKTREAITVSSRPGRA
jgi:hypothetical protein